MNLDQTQALTSLTLGFVALVGAGAGWLRWVRPRIQKARTEVVAVRDSILGRDAIVDSITKREIEPALPGIGIRIDSVERSHAILAEAVAKIADSRAQLENHEDRIQRLEAASVERVVTKAESAAAWRAVEAVAQQSAAEPPIPPEDQTSGD